MTASIINTALFSLQSNQGKPTLKNTLMNSLLGY